MKLNNIMGIYEYFEMTSILEISTKFNQIFFYTYIYDDLYVEK